MNTPNVYTIETLLKAIDFCESSKLSYMDRMEIIHLHMCSIVTLADTATYKACSIISQNYTHAQLQIELTKLNLIGGTINE